VKIVMKCYNVCFGGINLVYVDCFEMLQRLFCRNKPCLCRSVLHYRMLHLNAMSKSS
jgi:hypothetical protein